MEKESIFFTDKEDLESYSLSNQFAEHMEFMLVKDKYTATDDDAYFALSLAVRDRLVKSWLRTQHEYFEQDTKRVYYLSLEYLMGRVLGNPGAGDLRRGLAAHRAQGARGGLHRLRDQTLRRSCPRRAPRADPRTQEQR